MAASKSSAGRSSAPRGTRSTKTRGGEGVGDGLAGLAEQLANRIIKPLGVVVLSRERIQETLDEAAERGRLTRTDSRDIAALLIQRGRQQTDELLSDIERVLGRSRQQLDSATLKARRSDHVDRLVRGADRA